MRTVEELTMTKRFLNLLAAPEYPDDEEKNRRSHVLNVLIISLTASIVIIGSVGWFFIFPDKFLSGIFIIIGTLIGVATIIINRHGHQTSAAVILCTALLGLNTMMMVSTGGLQSYDILFLIPGTIVAGIVLGATAAWIYAGASVLITLGLLIAQLAGTTFPMAPFPPQSIFVIFLISLGITVLPLNVTLQSLAHALQRARENEEKYRLISTVSSDYMFSTRLGADGSLKLDWVAGAFETITGYSFEEYLAAGGWLARLHPDDVEQDRQDMERLNNNQSVVTEVRTLHKDGSIRWVRSYAQPVWDSKNDRLVGINGAVQDITERKKTEQALRDSDERYRSFISQSSEGIRRYDLDEPIPTSLPEEEQLELMFQRLYIAECNDAFAHMYGMKNASELIGRRLSLMGLENDPHNIESLRSFIRSGYKALDVESRELDINGKEHFLLINTVGMVENGYLTRVWGTQRDITERKKVELEIKQLNEQLELRVQERTSQLEVANKELESFSYSVSHDLRAPLRAIKSFTDIVIKDFGDPLDPVAQNFLSKVMVAAIEMNDKIDSLLKFSRLSRGSITREDVDLSAMAASVLETLRIAEPNRNINILIQNEMSACADPTLMRTVLENLLGNAWKYSSKVECAKIEFGSQSQNNSTTYFVRDNGAGFEMEYANNLFGMFQRLHTSDEFSGHGIGLATVQRIISRHEGRIWAEAEVGKGATFYFTIGE